MKSRFLQLKEWVRKRFSVMRIIVVIFLVIIVLVDENSMLQSYKLQRKINDLENEIDHYQQVIDESKAQLNELQSDDQNLEKFGREQYLMKRPNEEIFVITD